VAEATIAHQRLSGHLQEHAAKSWQGLAHLGHSMLICLVLTT
jgi:hypothetical protein